MSKKNIYIVVIFLLGFSSTYAQFVQDEKEFKSESAIERKADNKVYEQNYEAGIGVYAKMLESADEETSIRLNHKLAQVYYEIRDYNTSLSYYNFLLTTNNQDVLSVDEACNILTMLNRLDSSDQAQKWADIFSKNGAMTQNQRFRNLQRSLLGVEVEVPNDTLMYEITDMPFNTEYSEFWTAEVSPDLFAFIRSDAGDNSAKTMFQGSRFYTYQKSTGEVKPYEDFPLIFQAGPAAFFEGGKSMIYTDNVIKNSQSKVSSRGQRNLQLIYATYDAGRKTWKSEKSIFKAKTADVSYFHPALANNDKTLFFCSDMPGGYGGSDLYKSEYDVTAKRWGPPINLGSSVNTSGDEIFPSVRDNILYFASDAQIGYGGYDIYGINLTSTFNVTGGLVYLPEPINSRFNDFALFLDKDKKSGFFTSDRNGGKGIDDIYNFASAKRPKKEPAKVDTTRISNDSLNIITNTQIYQSVISANELSNIYFAFNKSNITEDYMPDMENALAEMMKPENSKTAYLLLGSADSRGPSTYNKTLSIKRANEVKKWLVNKGISPERLVATGRGSISLSDKEIREALGLEELTSSELSDKDLIKKAQREARRVTIKTIPSKD